MLLSPDSSIPLYHQLSEAIADQISHGVLKAGDKIIPEVEMSEKYGVSRVTVRRALLDLEKEGLLIRQQGKGTFVNKSKISERPAQNPSFTSVVREQGAQLETRLLNISIVPASEDDIRILQAAENERILFVHRLRFVDGLPVLIERSFFRERFIGLFSHNLEKESVYSILKEEFGVGQLNASKTIELAMATAFEADLLKLKADAPVLLLREIVRDENGETIHRTKEVIAGERYRIEL